MDPMLFCYVALGMHRYCISRVLVLTGLLAMTWSFESDRLHPSNVEPCRRDSWQWESHVSCSAGHATASEYAARGGSEPDIT